MKVINILFPIFIGFVDKTNTEIPMIKSKHAIIGKYPLLNMEGCGYVTPRDKSNNRNRNAMSRIIEGEAASLGDFPWHVMMFLKEENRPLTHLCDGVLIHKLWVVSDRHCVESFNTVHGPIEDKPEFAAEQLVLAFGTVDKRDIYMRRNVSLILRYPFEDLALFKVDKEVNPILSADGSYYRINYICLPQQNALNDEEEVAIMSGAGHNQILDHINTVPQKYNNLLRKATLRISPYSDCLTRKFQIYIICAPTTVNMSCVGDSGAGLFQFSDDYRAILIGTIIGGQKFIKSDPVCSPGVILFIRTSYFINFFQDAIESNYTLPYIYQKAEQLVQQKPLSSTTPRNGGQHYFRAQTDIVFDLILVLINICWYLKTNTN